MVMFEKGEKLQNSEEKKMCFTKERLFNAAERPHKIRIAKWLVGVVSWKFLVDITGAVSMEW